MKHLIAIAGPTASGKTALSIRLAQTFSADIISADARQFYRGMDLGTAKPSREEQELVKHHFIDILEPDATYTAGQFEKDAMDWLSHYFKSADVAIVCGGSGLYLKALMEGIDDLPATPKHIRDHYNLQYETAGLEALTQELRLKDPIYFSKVDHHNRQRVQRALEAIEFSGKPFSEMQVSSAKPRPFKVAGILLWPPRESLYEKINMRVDKMVEQGLEEEAKRFYSLKHCNALKTVGYQEYFDFFDGKTDKATAILKIKQHSRNYAKRQYTWFRNQSNFKIFETNDEEAIIRHLKKEMNV